MKHLKRPLCREVVGRVALLLCLTASAAFADLVTLRIVGLPNGSNSPYSATITPTGATVLIACLDINRHVSANTNYTYDRSLNYGPANWAAPVGLPLTSPQYRYDAAALLMQQLLATGPPYGTLSATDDLSYAIWEVFDSAAATGRPNALAAATAALNNAQTAGYVIPNYYIYTPYDDVGQAKQRYVSLIPGTHHVPDGGFNMMLLGGVLVGIECLRRKLRGQPDPPSERVRTLPALEEQTHL